MDDTLMVLRAAKIAGFRTALRRGELYGDRDDLEHERDIDPCYATLEDILRLLYV